jgi:hypothetical protein
MGMCGKVCDKKGNAKIVKKRKSNLDVKKRKPSSEERDVLVQRHESA